MQSCKNASLISLKETKLYSSRMAWKICAASREEWLNGPQKSVKYTKEKIFFLQNNNNNNMQNKTRTSVRKPSLYGDLWLTEQIMVVCSIFRSLLGNMASAVISPFWNFNSVCFWIVKSIRIRDAKLNKQNNTSKTENDMIFLFLQIQFSHFV